MSDPKIEEVLRLILAKLKEQDSRLQSLAGQVNDLKGMLDSGAAKASASEDKGEAPSEASKLKSILVVDDDPNLVNTFKLILENVGFNVDTANNGINALFKASKLHYDLVILDMNLPDMLGDELARRIRQRKPDMKVIMVTGYSSYMEELEKEEEIRKVLMKPVPPEDLVEMARRAITSEGHG
ncbi:response regulator [Candidatus Bathyarchaeota archaeon]|nr:response regulator [Candidatus Bathyarchaeota archaeon]